MSPQFIRNALCAGHMACRSVAHLDEMFADRRVPKLFVERRDARELGRRDAGAFNDALAESLATPGPYVIEAII